MMQQGNVRKFLKGLHATAADAQVSDHRESHEGIPAASGSR
jgi:hypothetical protein